MPDDHYIEPLDHTTTAGSMPDHSELTTIYPDPAKPNLGRIVNEQERQQIKQAQQERVMLRLRHLGPRAGLLTGIPVVIGIALMNFFAQDISAMDRSIIMPMFVFLVLFFGVYIGITLTIIKWLRTTYRNHLLKAWPVTTTVLTSMLLVAKPTFAKGSELIGGIAGYGASIGALLVFSTLLTTLLVLIWTTPKLLGLAKMIVLLVTIGAAAGVAVLL